jgi:5-methylcytosine-specific restriction endonuclease McrA
MSSSFLFDQGTKARARLRQNGRCAACSRQLNNLVEHAHHVVPKQTGTVSAPHDQWLRSLDNCVILCDDCHTAYHGHGRFRTVTAEPAVFKFAHGKNFAAHQQWLIQANLRFMQMGKKTA